MNRALLRRLGVAVQILCGGLMALGAVGHSIVTGPRIQSGLAISNVNPDLQRLLIVVWHFGGLWMVLLGGLVAVAARMPTLQPAAIASAFAYTAFGLVAWTWSGMPFFLVFTALGLAVLGAARLVCSPSPHGGYHRDSRHNQGERLS